MAKRRVHEIAKDQGLSANELLAKLQAAGIEAKAAASSVDEEQALSALASNGAERQDRQGDEGGEAASRRRLRSRAPQRRQHPAKATAAVKATASAKPPRPAKAPATQATRAAGAQSAAAPAKAQASAPDGHGRPRRRLSRGVPKPGRGRPRSGSRSHRAARRRGARCGPRDPGSSGRRRGRGLAR